MRRCAAPDQHAEGNRRDCRAFNDTLDRDVVCGQHGWFELCEELALPGYPPLGPGSANLSLVISRTPSEPISGSSPLRAQACEIAPLAEDTDVIDGPAT